MMSGLTCGSCAVLELLLLTLSFSFQLFNCYVCWQLSDCGLQTRSHTVSKCPTIKNENDDKNNNKKYVLWERSICSIAKSIMTDTVI